MPENSNSLYHHFLHFLCFRGQFTWTKLLITDFLSIFAMTPNIVWLLCLNPKKVHIFQYKVLCNDTFSFYLWSLSKMKSRNSVLLLSAASFLASLSSLVNCSSDPFREYDPVELTGSDVYELYGWDPASIIAFRYEDSDTWTQIPVQIDEMHQQLWEAVNPGDCR